MSIELVLFLVVFVLVPLIQHLMSAARAGQEPEPAQPAGTQSSAGVPPLRRVEQRPVPEDRTFKDATAAPERKPARKIARPPTPPIRRSGRRGTAPLGLRDALDRRRAIVLRTILGPCRASHPPDWPEGAVRR